MVLTVFCGTAGASVPSVDELLDRFAATMDRCQASYACTEEGTKVSVIRKALSPRYRLGEHKMHYRREYRWDGKRFRRRKHRWGDYEVKPFPRSRPKEKAVYNISLYDLHRTIQYAFILGDKPESGSLDYKARPMDRERLLRNAANNTVMVPRIDKKLRGCPNARVRPQTESINGADCYVLEGRIPEARYTVWIDPTHGYNIARYIRETKTDRAVSSNVAFRQIDGTWVPVESVTEMKTFMPPAPIDRSDHEHVKVTEFRINPDHDALKSFKVDEEIPNGTKVAWALPDGRVVMEDYVWKDGRPVPNMDEEIVGQFGMNAAILTRDHSMPDVNDQNGSFMEVAEIFAGYGSVQKWLRSLISKEETTLPGHVGAASQKCELRCDGVRLRYQCMQKADGLSYRIFLWDGTKLIQYQGASGQGAGGPVQITANISNRDALLAREYMGAPLMGFFQPDDPRRIDVILASAKQLSLERNVSEPVGRPCDVVKGVTDRGSYRIWFDPARYYHIVRAEVRRPGDSSEPLQAGRLLFLMENVRIKKIMGCWVAMEADIKRYSREDDSVTQYHQRRLMVQLRPNHERLGSFRAIGIPNRTEVVETDTNGRQRRGTWLNGRPVIGVK